MLAKEPLVVEFGKEDTTELILPRPPIFSSLKAGWNNVFLEYHYQPSGEHQEICTSGHTVAVFTKVSDRNQAERTLDGRFYQHSVRKGDLIINPAYVGHKSSNLTSYGNFFDHSRTHFLLGKTHLFDGSFERYPR
jgi:AraC family transcriptional regulator